MIFIDSDNALGSPSGDVDDAFAIVAILRSGLPVAGLSSCSGNTTEPRAFENNRRLATLLGWGGPLLRAAEARDAVRTFEGRILALGPLTNVTEARRASEIVIVGANSTSRGVWPPLWPYEFNLTKDRRATLAVFALDVPLTIIPLDVARQLWVEEEALGELPGALGGYLREGSRRWFTHLRRARFTRRFPIYDLAAALYAIADDGFSWRETTASINSFAGIRFGAGARRVRLCVGLDRRKLWRRFVALTGGVS